LTPINVHGKISTNIDIDPCSPREAPMARLQLALNVSDLDAAVDFYSKLFDAQPAKRRPGYANFAIAEPPLKLVLFENGDHDGRLNHLGVEVESTAEVAATQARLSGQGLETATEDGVTCCYAVQDKVWVDDPDGAPWEVYTVLEDADAPGGEELRQVEPGEPGSACTCG
jgi:catechol 2,3-dioxygenase-like lactoylglutathione lyase family enzyme